MNSKHFWKASIAFLLSLLCACASIVPDETRVELSHISHPFAGRPFGPSNEEDSLDAAQVVAGYKLGDRGYLDLSCGVRLRDRGFYGPREICSVRSGFIVHSKTH